MFRLDDFTLFLSFVSIFILAIMAFGYLLYAGVYLIKGGDFKTFVGHIAVAGALYGLSKVCQALFTWYLAKKL